MKALSEREFFRSVICILLGKLGRAPSSSEAVDEFRYDYYRRMLPADYTFINL